MPLHDWTDDQGWEGVHLLWIAELLRWIKPRLPTGYRAYIGSVPTVAVGAPSQKPDVSVRHYPEEQRPAANGAASSGAPKPDQQIAVATIDLSKAVYVESRGRLIASVELISPRNKDRDSARATYLARYVGYLLEGVHLLLTDVHRRPLAFSFADQIARELQIEQPHLPAPFAVGYRVGPPAASGGRLLDVWRRQLTVGESLPLMALPINEDVSVPVDLEQTYMRAAADAYLS